MAKRPKSYEPLLLAGSDTTLYKSVTMRVNSLSLDRPDLSFAAGSLARGMKSPATKDLEELKGSWTMLAGATSWRNRVLTANIAWSFWRCSATQTMLETWERAKPALEWQIMCGSHLIKHESAVHSTIALISGESEHHALFRSSAHAFGIKAMLNDWHDGVKCEVHIRCDSSAARGTSARHGW